MTETLAIHGGAPAVTAAHPHEVWPPPAEQPELDRLSTQRNLDISIRANAGPVGELESAFRARFAPECPYVVAFNSGTSAMYAALAAIGVGPGDEVIAPVLTYHAAVSPARMLGAQVRLADIDLDSRGVTAASVEAAVTPRTRAIVVVHQWGHPADIESVVAFAQRRNISVVEDCSHAHGSSVGHRQVGSFGDVAIYSLQANKAVFAGEGGILTTKAAEIADRAILVGHYRDRAKSDVASPLLQPFWETGFGMKLRMSPFNAIVALGAVANFDQVASGRQAALSYLNEQLAESLLLDPVHTPAASAMGAWYGYKPLITSNVRGVGRATLIRALQAEGVEVDVPSGRMLARLPLFSSTVFDWRTATAADTSTPPEEVLRRIYPNAYEVESYAVSLPTFYRWPQDQQVIDQYVTAFSKVAVSLASLTDDRIGAMPYKAPDDTVLPRDAASKGR